jgi:hypothetical protein
MSAITIEEAETCSPINHVASVGAVAVKANLDLFKETDTALATPAEAYSPVDNNIYDNMDFWQKGSTLPAQDPYKSYSYWTGAGLLKASMEDAQRRYAIQQALRRT